MGPRCSKNRRKGKNVRLTHFDGLFSPFIKSFTMTDANTGVLRVDQYDAVIVSTGLAGLTCGLELADQGKRVFSRG